MANVLGLDVGQKKIGVAIGDVETKLAFPRPALLLTDYRQAWPALRDLVASEHISTIIIGLPLDTNGGQSAQASWVQQFADELKQHVSVPVVLHDERYSTQAVQREQQSAGRKLSRGQEDSLAAQLLVESYLQSRP